MLMQVGEVDVVRVRETVTDVVFRSRNSARVPRPGHDRLKCVFSCEVVPVQRRNSFALLLCTVYRLLETSLERPIVSDARPLCL